MQPTRTTACDRSASRPLQPDESSGKPRLLFVDDDANFLAGLKRLLRDQRDHWHLHFANSVDQAVEAFQRVTFDAIVADVQMPVKDGFDLLRHLQTSEETKDIPVIMFTGGNDLGLKRRALDCGATDLLSKPTTREDLLARLRNVLRIKSYQDRLKLQNEVLERTVHERTRELRKSRIEVIWFLGKAAEYRDEATGNHVVRVGYYCQAIATAMGLDRRFVEMLFHTSPLHDIGKIGIPDDVLLKPSKLTPSEWAIIQQHCAIGANILGMKSSTYPCDRASSKKGLARDSDTSDLLMNMAAMIALTHHEWWNGKGYPQGLVGDDIPLESRIVAVADVYDSLGSERPYKPAFPERKILEIMHGERDSHFDPTVFDAFLRCLDEIREIRHRLNDHSPANMFTPSMDRSLETTIDELIQNL